MQWLVAGVVRVGSSVCGQGRKLAKAFGCLRIPFPRPQAQSSEKVPACTDLPERLFLGSKVVFFAEEMSLAAGASGFKAR